MLMAGVELGSLAPATEHEFVPAIMGFVRGAFWYQYYRERPEGHPEGNDAELGVIRSSRRGTAHDCIPLFYSFARGTSA